MEKDGKSAFWDYLSALIDLKGKSDVEPVPYPKVCKGGVNTKPTTPRPPPPKGQGGSVGRRGGGA